MADIDKDGESSKTEGTSGDDNINITNATGGKVQGNEGNDTINITDSTTRDVNADTTNYGDGSSTNGDDIVNITNSETGSIRLGYGEDSLSATDSTITGNVDYSFSDYETGAGNTYNFDNTDISGDVKSESRSGQGEASESGADSFTFENSSNVGGRVETGSGDDEITITDSTVGLSSTNAGSKSVKSGSGDDTITATNAEVGANVDAGDGDDIIDLDNVTTGGDDTNSAGRDGTISGGRGDDQFTLNDVEVLNADGTTTGKIDGGDGDDSFKIEGFEKSSMIIDGKESGEDNGGDTLDLSALNGRIEVTYDENDPESGTISYTDGTSDNTIEFSNIENIILVCFTTGMMIETEDGEVAVEDLKVGDKVLTKDHGLQPIRFAYHTKTIARGANAPVLFEAHSIGNDRPLLVSRKHNMYTGTLPDEALPKFLNGFKDHLVEADKLVNGSTIRLINDGREVTYYHIMLNQHELLYCHGTVSESWHPLRRNLRRFNKDRETRSELLRLVPEIQTNNASNTPHIRKPCYFTQTP